MQILLHRRVFMMRFALLFAFTGMAQAQSRIVYDWQGGSGGTLASYPISLNSTKQITFTVDNVNNLLYSYGITGSCVQNAADPWGSISTLLVPAAAAKTTPPAGKAPAAAPAPNSCAVQVPKSNASIKKFQDDYNAFLQLPIKNPSNAACSATAPCRVSLSDAEAALTPIQIELRSALSDAKNAIAACQAESDTAATFGLTTNEASIEAVQNHLDTLSPHSWSTTVSVPPDSTCNFSIIESYNGTATKPPQTVQFVAGQPRMTLSAGALVSELQARSYSTVTAPPATGSTTNQTELKVDGKSKFSFYLAGLVNIAVPVSWLNKESVGTALSLGPVIRVGSQSTSFPVGFFAGGSLHISHLLYLSAGAHIGQFSDYPAGFTSAGQVVPSGFPTPVGQDHTSVRFAFALTLKAKDLSGLGSSTAK
jgi:hypothetical protein